MPNVVDTNKMEWSMGKSNSQSHMMLWRQGELNSLAKHKLTIITWTGKKKKKKSSENWKSVWKQEAVCTSGNSQSICRNSDQCKGVGGKSGLQNSSHVFFGHCGLGEWHHTRSARKSDVFRSRFTAQAALRALATLTVTNSKVCKSQH